MIPSYFIKLEKMPLTPNGKIDTKAFPEPDITIDAKVEYAAPINFIEKTLISIWQNVLGVERIGINDNFFELGGNSLNAINIITKIHKQLELEVKLTEIFKHPVLIELAKCIKYLDKNIYTEILPVEEKEYYEVSSAQKRLYVLSQLDPKSINYNIPGAMVIEGKLDVEKFEDSFVKLINRHEALRTSFDLIDGQPVQKINSYITFNIPVVKTEESKIKEVISGCLKPFDLAQAPLLGVELLKIDDDKHIMLFNAHHIIFDAISMSILTKEVAYLYEGKKLSDLKIQYKDFSAWNNELLKSDKIKKQKEYWVNRFSGVIPVLSIPTDYERPSVQSFDGDRITFKTDKDMQHGLNSIAQFVDATLYMVLLAAYNILLYKYTGQEDIIIGSPVAGRNHSDLEGIFGMFVNTLAIRNYPAEDKTFIEFLLQVKENCLGAFENQDYQFEELVEKLDIKRDLSRNPLFDTMFTLQNTGNIKINISDLKFTQYNFEYNMSKFDITLTAIENSEGISFDIEYCTKLFKKDTIERFVEHFINVLKAILENHSVRISEIDILTSNEKEKILFEFNDTEAPYPKDKTINQLFEEQVKRTPETTAVTFEGKMLTYFQLNQMANVIASTLREKGCTSDSIIAVIVKRSHFAIACIIGILKAGGAYLPIDSSYPKDRIKYMLEDSKAQILITQSKLLDSIEFDNEIIEVDSLDYESNEISNLENISNANDRIYIIYTSGTTGMPKGVILEHRNLVNLVCFEQTNTNIDFSKKVMQFANMSFDVYSQEVFSTLLYGGTLYIINEEDKKDIFKLINFIETNNIEIIFLPTSYFKFIITNDEFINKIPSCLIHIITAGEQLILTKSFLEKLKQNKINLHNHYGPSETHVVTTLTIKDQDKVSLIPPIGKPIQNNKIYILNKNNSLQPIGLWGELYIFGDNVGRGYLNRPDLTKDKFVQNPFVPGEHMYRTGDLARWLPDGNIEFLGRIDHQVKIRGFRIELGEIESQLLNYESIKEAVVLAKENSKGDKTLSAYIVATMDISFLKLREYLSKQLPGYMIPSYFIQLEKIPLTPNLKVDRFALPEPDGNISTGVEYTAPNNLIEDKLVNLWQEILGVKKVGITDNFFELGGHSLNAMKVISEAYKNNWNVTLSDLFKHPTIKQFSDKIISQTDGINGNDLDIPYVNKHPDKIQISNDLLNFDNILLTGATGYLGAHILGQLMEDTKSNVYCIVRGKNKLDSEARLTNILSYYFDNKYDDLINIRIFILSGDISNKNIGLPLNDYDILQQKIDMIINAAGLVKHYGNYSDFKSANIISVKELIKFCRKKNIKLNHISTIGVLQCEVAIQNSNIIATENDLYIGQDYTKNVYIKSKFEAESLILKEIELGLDATIFRVGNLTERYGDGKFQKNKEENNFHNILRAILKLQAISLPQNELEKEIEFTPIDYCSKAIVSLTRIKKSEGFIFHLFNNKKIKLTNLLNIFGTLETRVEILKDMSFAEYINYLQENKKDFQQEITYLINHFNYDNDPNSPDKFPNISSEITEKYLSFLGFAWPEINLDYLKKVLKNLS